MKHMDMLVIAGVLLCSILIIRSWWQKHCRLVDSLRRYRGESTMNDDWATHEVRAAQPGGEQSTLDRLWQGWAAELLRGEHTRTVQIVQKAETLLDNPTEPERYAQFRAGFRQACHDILAELQRERHGRQSTPR